jgi:hypothetical protein
MAVDSIHMTGFDFMADEQTREAVGFLLREHSADRQRTLTNWYATATQWPKKWQKASSDAHGHLDLDATQTRALADELAALVNKYRKLKPGPDARKIDIQYAVFPAETGDVQ